MLLVVVNLARTKITLETGLFSLFLKLETTLLMLLNVCKHTQRAMIQTAFAHLSRPNYTNSVFKTRALNAAV